MSWQDMILKVTMPPRPALGNNSASAVARAPAQGSTAEPDEQWKQVWDETEQLRVNIFNRCYNVTVTETSVAVLRAPDTNNLLTLPRGRQVPHTTVTNKTQNNNQSLSLSLAHVESERSHKKHSALNISVII